ncbi:MAG: methionyl-tRNA formyltransferase [Cyclobacteriaceae bacterium]|nr:methionyl-tRNA formyltransferase [Cyclobacteriaceae bacterium]
MRIVFMGTPEFAVPGLKILVENNYEIVGVVTAPDKPQGRGKKIRGSAVKEYAETQNLNILQPTNLKSEEFLNELRALKADLFIVIAFRMLPESVWSMPPLGTFNLHGSLLPQYRGAAPIHWAIINGEKETGLTTFFLKHEIDTGDIILQEKEPILPDDTTGSLYLRLMHKGAGLILKTVQLIESGKVSTTPQIFSDSIKEAPKLTRENTEINWNQPAEIIYNFIRGLNPFPAAWTLLNEKYYKIYDSSLSGEKYTLKPGEIKVADSRLWVGTSTQSLEVIEFQAEGKRRMFVSEYLKGNTL